MRAARRLRLRPRAWPWRMGRAALCDQRVPAPPARLGATERQTTGSGFISTTDVGKTLPRPWPKEVTNQVERAIKNEFGAVLVSKSLSKPYRDVGTSSKRIQRQRKTIQVSLDHFSGHCLRSERDQIVSKCCQ